VPDKIRIIAAIPCFNTEPHIAEVVTGAKKYVDRVIVINDGSHDQTKQAAQGAGALVISHEGNKGYGEALNSCFKAARSENADILVIIDGDGQHEPEEIPRLLSPILNEGADIVIGSRFITHRHNMPGYRKFGIAVITLLWNIGGRVKVTDTQSGFRVFSKKVIEKMEISENGMLASIEVLERARRSRAKIVEVPISCIYIDSRFSLNAVKHGIRVAFGVVKIRLLGDRYGCRLLEQRVGRGPINKLPNTTDLK
jgi:glycosyltransferase involved in cell wall biosynthesis